jgi:AcrR family transcriptional regulator
MPARTPRKRRSSLEARTAILDAAEKRLVEAGPGGIRLQDVAADVGVSHPTVLHHFGSREGLINALVERALEDTQRSVMEAVQAAPARTDTIAAILDGVFAQMKQSGRARAFLWLALSGFAGGISGLNLVPLAEFVHAVRTERRGKKKPRAFEDTYFSILLPALSLLTLAALEPSGRLDPRFDGAKFRAWLAELIHTHLERD